MTQYQDSTLSYGNTPRSNAMALTAMILGLIAIPTGCVVIGVPLGIVAMILGIIAIGKINKNPTQYGGKGMAVTGIATGAASFLTLGMILVVMLPSLGKARELSQRSVCAANVRGIMQSLVIYAADNVDAFPVVAKTGGYGLASAGSGTAQTDSDDTIKSMYTTPPSPSVTQNIWILVLNGQIAAKQFICKSDPSPVVPAAFTIAGNYPINFNDGAKPSDLAYSYSFAYPWTSDSKAEIGAWWKNPMDASLPLIADMAPFDGSGRPPATPGKGMSRNANSFNHQRDGQVVGFADAHSEFCRTPAVGSSNDNIYTANGGTPHADGTPPAGKIPNVGTGGSMGAFDTCLVPAADANSGYSRK